MKKKIIGVLVFMLLIATAIPAVKSLTDIKPVPTLLNHVGQPCETVGWNEIQKLLASDGSTDDLFGVSIALEGDTLFIGASSDDEKGSNAGSVYVFNSNGTAWIQQEKLYASDYEAEDAFGYSVYLDGDYAFIGAPMDDDNGEDSGSVYVFVLFQGSWRQQQKILASDGTSEDHFGYSVSSSGDTGLIGSPDADIGGAAYVFTRTTDWKQQTKLFADDGTAKDGFGRSVSINDDTALIGAFQDDEKGEDSGSAYVFIRDGQTWSQQAKLVAMDGAAGDYFGEAVSLSDNTAVTGAPRDDDNGVDSGSAYVFIRDGTTWSQQQKLHASTTSGYFGSSISQDGDYALIGAPQSEAAYVFLRTGTTWPEEAKLIASDGGGSFNNFGESVSISGEIAAISAPFDDDLGSHSGSVYMFESQYATYDLEFEIKGGLGVKLTITNIGTVNATDVYWQVHIEGGKLGRINKTVDETVDILIGKTKTVRTGIFFGFGAISISARVIHEEKIVEGTQFIILSMVK
ncbi:MAG: FG-GAP repeat protein [Candidatus Thermoplasmatota archaeon]|nr:FG-GAP repeat protein [Candidatus Thermoplasmatota archaeon]